MAKKAKAEVAVIDKGTPIAVKATLVPEPDVTVWGRIKGFFKRSETIFLARAEVVVGVVIAGVAAMDWSPLLSLGVDTGFSWKQVAFLGAVSIFRGVTTEVARRRGTVEVEHRLLPVA